MKKCRNIKHQIITIFSILRSFSSPFFSLYGIKRAALPAVMIKHVSLRKGQSVLFNNLIMN